MRLEKPLITLGCWLKPGAEFTFDDVLATLQKLAVFIPVSEEMLEDSAAVRDYINAQLPFMVRRAEDKKLAAEMGAADPESLAHQLALLIDGAIVAAMVSRNPDVADTAGLAAGSLFGPAKVKKPKRVSEAPQLVAV